MWHRVSLEVLPLWQAAILRDAAAFRRAFLLRVEAIGAPDAVGFRSRSRRVLVRVDGAKCAIVHTTAFPFRAVCPLRTLFRGGHSRRGFVEGVRLWSSSACISRNTMGETTASYLGGSHCVSRPDIEATIYICLTREIHEERKMTTRKSVVLFG